MIEALLENVGVHNPFFHSSFSDDFKTEEMVIRKSLEFRQKQFSILQREFCFV
jgi:hypothetical protein